MCVLVRICRLCVIASGEGDEVEVEVGLEGLDWGWGFEAKSCIYI